MPTTPSARVRAVVDHLRADERLWPLFRRRIQAAPPDDPCFPYLTVEPARDFAMRVCVVSDFGDSREVQLLLAKVRDSLDDSGLARVTFSDWFRSAVHPSQHLGVLRVRLSWRAAARNGYRPPVLATAPATAPAGAC